MIDRMIELVASPDIPQTYSAILSHFSCSSTSIRSTTATEGRGGICWRLYLSEPLSETTVLSLSRVIAENKSKYYKAFDVTERPMNHAEATFFVMQIIELIRLAQDSLIEEHRTEADAARRRLRVHGAASIGMRAYRHGCERAVRHGPVPPVRARFPRPRSRISPGTSR